LALRNKTSETTFGLDIGSTAVRAMQIRKEVDGYTVLAAGSADYADSDQSQFADMQDISVDTIYRCLRSTPVDSTNAIGGVTGPEVALRGFSFPPMSDEELMDAVQLEAEHINPVEASQAIVDYHVFPEGSDGDMAAQNEASNDRRGIVAAASQNVVSAKQAVIEQANLTCSLVDINTLAILNCFYETEPSTDQTCVAILNIDQDFSNIIITNKETLPFFRDLPHGAGEMVGALAKELDDTPENVKTFLLNPETLGDSNLNLTVTLSRACQTLISAIMETMRFYMLQNKGQQVDELRICGEFAQVNNFIEVLKMHIPNGVTLWNPVKEMKWQVPSETETLLDQSGPAFVVAAGLALRTL
jgi:type IV pilus assembly protein PilM